MHTLSEDEKQLLLTLARSAINNVVFGRKMPPPIVDNPTLNKPAGVFVTLYVRGELRGCIGTIEEDKPLVTAVVEMAEEAARHDPRFKPVRVNEIQDLEIEISVLSPMQPLRDPKMITVGVHGLMVEKGFSRGLLLPQVAVENQWDAMTFLRHTCLKAGLPMDAWQDSQVKIYFFTAQVFREDPQASMITK